MTRATPLNGTDLATREHSVCGLMNLGPLTKPLQARGRFVGSF